MKLAPADGATTSGSDGGSQASLPAVVEEVTPEIVQLLRDNRLPVDEKASKIISQVFAVSRRVSYRGMLPPAEMLEDFERVQPGLGKQIVGWTDYQIHHRIDLEKVTTHGEERRLDLSQRYSFFLQMLSLVIAAAVVGGMLYLDRFNWVGAIIVLLIVAMTIGGSQVAHVVGRIVSNTIPSLNGKTADEDDDEDERPQPRKEQKKQPANNRSNSGKASRKGRRR
jgi:hypothetical protein